MVCSSNSDTDFLQGNTLAPFLFLICLDFQLWMPIDLIKGNVYIIKKARNRWYPTETIANAGCADDVAHFANTSAQSKSLLHSLEQAAGDIGLYINSDKSLHVLIQMVPSSQ